MWRTSWWKVKMWTDSKQPWNDRNVVVRLSDRSPTSCCDWKPISACIHAAGATVARRRLVMSRPVEVTHRVQCIRESVGSHGRRWKHHVLPVDGERRQTKTRSRPAKSTLKDVTSVRCLSPPQQRANTSFGDRNPITAATAKTPRCHSSIAVFYLLPTGRGESVRAWQVRGAGDLAEIASLEENSWFLNCIVGVGQRDVGNLSNK